MRVAWPGAQWRRRAARLCVWLAVAGFALALARPSTGTGTASDGGVLELVVDVSGSTNATDVAPSRLLAMKRSALRLIEELPPSVRVGLVSFSGRAAALAAPGTDRDPVARGIASLNGDGPTAIGDALRLALTQISAARPAGPATVLLLSDGSNTAGSDPGEAARAAAARHVRIFGVAVGRPDGTVVIPDEQTGQPRQVPVPPDPVGLAAIADATGGRIERASSVSQLDEAMRELAAAARLLDDPRDLSMPIAVAALLLLVLGMALAPSPHPRAAPLPGAWRGELAAAALLAVCGIVAGGAVRAAQGPLPRPAVEVGTLTASAALPQVMTAPAQYFVRLETTTSRDRSVLEQAVALLRRHGELADQRQAEIRQRRMNHIDELGISACNDCKATELATSPHTYAAVNGLVRDCGTILNMPFVRQHARAWHVPEAQLAAMLMLHEQELCLHGSASTTVPTDAERRLAHKLHNDPLFDRLYVQIDAEPRDRAAVERAAAIVRQHGEMAVQRRDTIRRQHRNQVEALQITACRGCRNDASGVAFPFKVSADVVSCGIVIEMSFVERNARGWGLPVTDVLAVLLAHEQEHCIRYPDDHERPAVDEEVRLARKLGKVRLLEYTTATYQQLDRDGYWKR